MRLGCNENTNAYILVFVVGIVTVTLVVILIFQQSRSTLPPT